MLTTTTVTVAAAFAWAGAAQLYVAAGYLPALGLMLAVGLLLLPAGVLARPSRMFFAETVQRVLLPFQQVTWSDFLLADIFTSLAKSSYDFGRAACVHMTGANGVAWRRGGRGQARGESGGKEGRGRAG